MKYITKAAEKSTVSSQSTVSVRAKHPKTLSKTFTARAYSMKTHSIFFSRKTTVKSLISAKINSRLSANPTYPLISWKTTVLR